MAQPQQYRDPGLDATLRQFKEDLPMRTLLTFRERGACDHWKRLTKKMLQRKAQARADECADSVPILYGARVGGLMRLHIHHKMAEVYFVSKDTAELLNGLDLAETILNGLGLAGKDKRKSQSYDIGRLDNMKLMEVTHPPLLVPRCVASWSCSRWLSSALDEAAYGDKHVILTTPCTRTTAATGATGKKMED